MPNPQILMLFAICIASSLLLITQSFSLQNTEKLTKNQTTCLYESLQYEESNQPVTTHFSYVSNAMFNDYQPLSKCLDSIGYDLRYMGNQTYATSALQTYNFTTLEDYKDPLYYPQWKINGKTSQINGTQINYSYSSVELLIKLNWKKTVGQKSINGTVVISASTQNLSFSAKINPSDDKIQNITINITNTQSFQFDFIQKSLSILPKDTSNSDVANINKFLFEGTVRKGAFLSSIKDFLDKNLPNKLASAFKSTMANYFPLFSQMKFAGGYTDTEIRFQKSPSSFEFGKNQLKLGFRAFPSDDYYYYRDIKWSKPADLNRTEPLDVKKYGGSQQFSSLSFYQSFLKFAIAYSKINIRDFKRYEWQSEVFHFQAIDLFQIIPKIAQSFKPEDPVNGSCKVEQSSAKISPSQNNLLVAEFTSNCYINVSNTTVQKFQIRLELDLKASTQNRYQINLYLDKYNFKVGYQPVGQYRVQDKDKADFIIERCLQNFYRGKMFGSRWPIPAHMKNPRVERLQNQILIYDLDKI